MAIYCDQSKCDGALRQCEILSQVICINPDVSSLPGNIEALQQNSIKVSLTTHTWAIVLSQDCDLSQCFNSGSTEKHKKTENILLCGLYTAQEIRYGPGMNSTIWNKVKINKDERYHFLEAIPAANDLPGEGLPEMTIDFKKVFTMPTDQLYFFINSGICKRRTVLISPYLEHLSHRYGNYISRVALPVDHLSHPEGD